MYFSVSQQFDSVQLTFLTEHNHAQSFFPSAHLQCCSVFIQLLLCPFWLDPMFELKVEDKDVLIEELQKPWQVQERSMETDISVLKWVEDLEQRVVAADLHLKVRNLLS